MAAPTASSPADAIRRRPFEREDAEHPAEPEARSLTENYEDRHKARDAVRRASSRPSRPVVRHRSPTLLFRAGTRDTRVRISLGIEAGKSRGKRRCEGCYVTKRVTDSKSKTMDVCNRLRGKEIWLTTLDDFRNWLIREAA